ncbi:MAG: ATP-binding protein [Bacteroidales bacterium]
MPIKSINLTPDPRILRMLGQIELKGWQCIAELIDNSIDAMIKTSNERSDNQIEIYIPSSSEIKREEPLKIKDNGIGMNEEELEHCLRAGYTSRDIDNLGLFGMGFNIATARLGDIVEVWTSTKYMNQDIGVKIDLLEMQKTGSFIRELKYRNKTLIPSGTQISIHKYHPRAEKLLNRTYIQKEIDRTYSEALLKDYNISIIINGRALKPYRFCVWDESRFVKYKGENIPAIIDFNKTLGQNNFCRRCFIWLPEFRHDPGTELLCPNCNSSDLISSKNVEVHGWVGIQRYNDPSDFGINIIRNGRIIKKQDKSFFTWQDRQGRNNGESIFEYPIDTPGQGGRIVGEIFVDFITPTYTKDSFEETDKLWLDAVEYIRGEAPLQPTIAQDLGFGKNKSPLAQLFYGYRKSFPPGKQNLIPGRKDGSGAYQLAREWGNLFYSGDPDYQDDSKWWEAVLEAELGPDEGDQGKKDPTKKTPKNPGGEKPEENPHKESFPGVKTHLLSKTYNLENLINEKPISVCVMQYRPSTKVEKPVILNSTLPNNFDVYINTDHQLFRDFADGWEDLLLMEIATKFYEKIDDIEEWPVSRLYYELKLKYANGTMLNIDELINSAKSLMKDIQMFLSNERLDICLEPKPILGEIDKKTLSKNYLEIENKNPTVESMIGTPRYLKYMDINYLFKFVDQFPELLMDNQFFSIPYKTIEYPDMRKRMIDQLRGYFNDIKWFIYDLSEYPDDLVKKQKNMIIRNRISLEFLNAKRV